MNKTTVDLVIHNVRPVGEGEEVKYFVDVGIPAAKDKSSDETIWMSASLFAGKGVKETVAAMATNPEWKPDGKQLYRATVVDFYCKAVPNPEDPEKPYLNCKGFLNELFYQYR